MLRCYAQREFTRVYMLMATILNKHKHVIFHLLIPMVSILKLNLLPTRGMQVLILGEKQHHKH